MFYPDPMKIIRINETQIVLRDKNGTQHRRNSSHVKCCQENLDPEDNIKNDRQQDEVTKDKEVNSQATQPETQQSTADERNLLRRSEKKRNPPDYLRY